MSGLFGDLPDARREMALRAEKIVRESVITPPDWDWEGIMTGTQFQLIMENHEAAVGNLVLLMVDFAQSEMER